MTRGEAEFWFNAGAAGNLSFRKFYQGYMHATGSRKSVEEELSESLQELHNDLGNLFAKPEQDYSRLRGRVAELERMVVGEYAKKLAEERLAASDAEEDDDD